MKEITHQKRLEQSNQLLGALDIRTGLREKLFYLYPDTFQAIHSILAQAESFDSLIQMHTIETMGRGKSGSNVIIYFNEELSHHAQLILQEIIDDYWACCLCFQNGFTKQSEGILRGTLELITQLYYLIHLNETAALTSDLWATGNRGIEKFQDKIEIVRKMKILEGKNFGAQLDSLYNRLCASTHSRKDRLTTMNLPRSERAKDMPSFEPLEILYTKSLFCCVLNLELKLIQIYFDKEPKTIWVEKIRIIIEKMLLEMNKMLACVQNFEKGYIIHREYVALSNKKQILYSITLDKKFEFPSRKKPKLDQQEFKEFQDKVEDRLVKDIN